MPPVDEFQKRATSVDLLALSHEERQRPDAELGRDLRSERLLSQPERASL